MEKGSAFSAPTLAELAESLRIPADTVMETVQKDYSYVEAGKDSGFDKPKTLLRSKIETPPFHAVWISLYVHDTRGGLACHKPFEKLADAPKTFISEKGADHGVVHDLPDLTWPTKNYRFRLINLSWRCQSGIIRRYRFSTEHS